jgi:hypothetical protein
MRSMTRVTVWGQRVSSRALLLLTAHCSVLTAQVTAVRAGTLADVQTGQLLRHQLILIEGDRITAVR